MAVLSAAIVGLLNTLIALEIRQEGKQICLYLAREGLEEVLHVRNQEGFDAITSNRFSQSETIEGYPGGRCVCRFKEGHCYSNQSE